MPRAASPDAFLRPTPRVAAAAGTLRAARADALAGRSRSARQGCAAVMIEHMPALIGEEALLCSLVEVLLHAKGYAMLARALATTFGRDAAFLPVNGSAGTLRPRLVRLADASVMRFAIDEHALGDPAHAALVREWSAQILSSARDVEHP